MDLTNKKHKFQIRVNGQGLRVEQPCICFSQRLLGLSMENPTPPLDTPEVFGGLKTRLFEGPKLIELERLGYAFRSCHKGEFTKSFRVEDQSVGRRAAARKHHAAKGCEGWILALVLRVPPASPF